MSKTKEEIKELKEEIASVNEKLQELTEEELEQVTGGGFAHSFEYGFANATIFMKEGSISL